ncbi:MAG: hypothetical protein GC172_04525 [Phycisphaera sp.]|nr:hypothetical protein [Phycisphaera sp.]
MQTNTRETTRPSPLATLLLGAGAALAVTLASPALADSKATAGKAVYANPIAKPVISAPKPVDVAIGADTAAAAATAIATILPPDPCAAGPEEYDCNQNGINDLCDIADGWADANEDGILDSCQFASGDLNLDGAVDAIDLVMILSGWGTEGRDTNDDGFIDALDLAAILSNWSVGG